MSTIYDDFVNYLIKESQGDLKKALRRAIDYRSCDPDCLGLYKHAIKVIRQRIDEIAETEGET